MRSAFDFAPFRRSSVGLDRLFDMLENSGNGGGENYPPFDLIRTNENEYRIELAVAGFKAEEIDIAAQPERADRHRRQAGRGRSRKARTTSIAALRRARSSAVSRSPTTSRCAARG